jgi:hypothetical protein
LHQDLQLYVWLLSRGFARAAQAVGDLGDVQRAPNEENLVATLLDQVRDRQIATRNIVDRH